MNAKLKILLVFAIVFFIFFQNPVNAMEFKELRKNQEDTVRKFEQQIIIEPEAVRNARQETLKDVLTKIEEPAIKRPASPLGPIRNQIDLLLSKEQVSPEEIDVLRKSLDRAANERGTEINSSEYKNLKEKLDITYNYTKAIAELKESQASLVKELNENFNAAADKGETVDLWKKVFSGGFAVSFLANMVGVFGFMIKVPNAKLEKQLKELQIIEKKAQLEQNGIDPKKYS